MRANLLLALVVISACDRPHESASQTTPLPEAGVAAAIVSTTPAIVNLADASAADAAIATASAPSAKPKSAAARAAEPTNCGQQPHQPRCNCFTDHPNATCFDP